MKNLFRNPLLSIAFIFLLCSNTLLSQGSSNVSAGTDQGGAFLEIQNLFQATNPEPGTEDILQQGTFLKLDRRILQQIMAQRPSNLHLEIPFPETGSMVIELSPNKVLSDGFKVKTPNSGNSQYLPGLYFKGKVAGNEKSMVTFSFFDDMVMGFISVDDQDYVLGHLHQDVFPAGNTYVLYATSRMKVLNPFRCGTEDIPIKEKNRPTTADMQRSASNLVEVYFEADYGLYQNKNSDSSQVVNYVTGLFNQCIAIYSNENITIQISEIFVWTTPDPYPGNSSSAALVAFRDSTGTNFNGDLAHLIALDPGGNGGIAYLDVLCNRFYAKGYSDINANYNNFPTYSWSVMVVTHELGHNLGSRHSHACVWGPGENAAIDGCGPTAGYSEGCTAPLPTNGGTIMSYCHLIGGVGINLSNGFGPNPGDLIRYEVSNASCLFGPGPKTNLDKDGADNLTVNGNVLTVTHAVINNDQLTADSSRVGYYLTPNSTLSTYDYFLGYNQLDSLEYNESTGTISFTVDIDTFSAIPPGTYSIGYILDYDYSVTEGNENDNKWRFTSPTITKTTNNTTCGQSYTLSNNANYATGAINNGNGCNNCSGGAQHARWFDFAPNADGYVDIKSCNQNVNTRLWVYDGSCGSLNQVASSDDDCSISNGGANTAAAVTELAVTNGSTYHLEWDNRWSSDGFNFEYAFYKAGERCGVATSIDNTGSYPKSISADGPASGNGCFNCNSSQHADWYKWVAPADGTLDVASCNGGEDTRIWIYSGSCGNLTQIGNSDDNCQMGNGQPNYASEVTGLAVSAGLEYFFEWDDRWSNANFDFTVDFTPSAPPVPDCTSLSSPANGASNVSVNADLTWTPATGNPTGYRLAIGLTPGGSEILTETDLGNQTSYDPGTLPYASTIYVRITPYNGSGNAAGCQEESFTTEPAPTCGIPSPGNHTIGNIEVTLRWNQQAGATKYQVQCRPLGQTKWTLKTTTTNSVLLKWLFYGTTYQYRIRTLCPSGWTAYSSIFSFTTLSNPDCTLPYETDNSVTDSSFTISWISVPNIQDLNFSYRRKGNTAWISSNLGSDTSFTANNLLAGNEYQYRFRAKCDGKWTSWSPLSSVVLLTGSGPCETPDTLNHTITNISATLRWTSENGATKYQVQYRIQGTSAWTTKTVQNATVLILKDLFYNTTYQYKIRAYCPSGWTAWTPVYSFTTLPTPACTLPLFSDESVTDTEITVSWLSVPGVASHELQYRQKGPNPWLKITLGADTSYTITGLQPATEYQYRLRARCGTKWTLFSPIITTTTATNRPFKFAETGGKNKGTGEEISLQPNPAREQIQVNLPSHDFHSVNLLDVNGKVLESKIPGPDQELVSFDLSHFTPGFYFIVAHRKDGQKQASRFIKAF